VSRCVTPPRRAPTTSRVNNPELRHPASRHWPAALPRDDVGGGDDAVALDERWRKLASVSARSSWVAYDRDW